MAVCHRVLLAVWNNLVLLGMLLWFSDCNTQYQAEEVEIFSSDKQAKLGWKSEPPGEWDEILMPSVTGSSVPVLQACGKKRQRTVLTPWMECKDTQYLLMDITMGQEEESSGHLSPLKVHLYDTNTNINRFQNDGADIDLQISKPFPASVVPTQIRNYLNRSLAISLGSVTSRGFQVGFSYTGTCVILTSIRLFYRRCPDIISDLTSFRPVGAGAGLVSGSCVEGAVEVSTPERECNVDGMWGSLQGRCTCERGHEEISNTCKACRIGYYKSANESRGCQLCPPNTRTLKEGSERCECQQGFDRLPTDPYDLGCTKPPSAPVNLTAVQHNDSTLSLVWDPPHDWGGRKELKYWVMCERKAEAVNQWEACGDRVVFQPDSEGLTATSVIIMQLNPESEYRLSVHTWNDISTLKARPHSSSATIIIYRRKHPPVETTVIPSLKISAHGVTSAPHKSPFFIQLTAGVLLGFLLLMAVILIVMCVLRKNYSKVRSDQEMELLPVNTGISYIRSQTAEAVPQQSKVSDGVIQLLEGFGGRLMANLKEVLVERNQLTLGKELGKGEFGSVYEGVFTPEEGGDMKVAVKTMRVGIYSQEDLHEFLKEAEIMKNFDHKNVVKLLGVTLQREQDAPLPVPLVILPYMKHGDLRRFLIATRYGDIPMFVPHQTLLRFMIDIAAGMDYLGSQGFLHRDLAARNCMLGDDLRVCVADFGLSKKIYSSNYYRQKVAIRVPIKWMAIESLSESVYTIKSDVWSFGVTIWEIVSRGKTPYPGVHNYELLDLLLSGHRLKPPVNCDHKLYEVMHSCWKTEPNLRPDFGDLLDALKSLLSELPALEACQEATYINQGLGAAAAAAASEDPQTNSAGKMENVYLPSPVGGDGSGNSHDLSRKHDSAEYTKSICEKI